ncbi:PilZ domain-containing protein [Prosthecomicrobium sp. N25]|uniref:PilZ domain-containing protein n=1 Tax=Prosthecomicrobium sp. N25 TaxID=3129254 RepID=UPI0030768888
MTEVQEMGPSNRRTSPRRKTYIAARAVMNGGFSTIDLTIRNLSEGGALLQLDRLMLMPRTFELTCKLFRRPVQVVWHRETQLGVAFAG